MARIHPANRSCALSLLRVNNLRNRIEAAKDCPVGGTRRPCCVGRNHATIAGIPANDYKLTQGKSGMKFTIPIAVALIFLYSAPSVADSTEARCDIYPAGQDHTDVIIPCRFSQRQGYITIARSDGVTHDLTPVGDAPGNFVDQYGQKVYRQSGLGDQGQIFRLPEESVFVYWSTAALNPDDSDNPTAPFSTRDYDATTILRCRASADAEPTNCPAGILRMDGGQASVVVLSPANEQFTINFMSDYVNAANRDVDARLEGDTWIVTINDSEIYEVPLAAIEGG
jgi:hypothetical protein